MRIFPKYCPWYFIPNEFDPFRRKNEINQIADETEEVEDMKEIIDDDAEADGTYQYNINPLKLKI